MNDNDEMREFMIVVRRAMLMIVRFIERKYHLAD
jgi:hypothetical protein